MSRVIDLPLPGLPGLLRMRMRHIGGNGGAADIEGSMVVDEDHLAPMGHLHAATAVALADTACGYGCLASLPPGKTGFTTIELKANFLGTAHAADRLTVYATAVHRGGATQIWDASVKVRRTDADPEKPIAVFRCTQLLLDPR
jgi:1,4-dihydroxy-2-naphthoyl-CoA hydrolase